MCSISPLFADHDVSDKSITGRNEHVWSLPGLAPWRWQHDIRGTALSLLCSTSVLSVPLVSSSTIWIAGATRTWRQNWVCEHWVARGWDYSLPKESQTPILRFFPIWFRSWKEVQHLSGMSIPSFALIYSFHGLLLYSISTLSPTLK